MSDAAEWILLIGRILFVLFFLFSVLGHFKQNQMMIGYARHKGMPLAGLAGWPAGLWMLIGSLSVLLGILPDVGALMLGLFVIPAGLWFHSFWKVDDEQQRTTELMNFMRNVALVGVALMLFAFFTTVGHDLRLVMTGPLFDLR